MLKALRCMLVPYIGTASVRLPAACPGLKESHARRFINRFNEKLRKIKKPQGRNITAFAISMLLGSQLASASCGIKAISDMRPNSYLDEINSRWPGSNCFLKESNRYSTIHCNKSDVAISVQFGTPGRENDISALTLTHPFPLADKVALELRKVLDILVWHDGTVEFANGETGSTNEIFSGQYHFTQTYNIAKEKSQCALIANKAGDFNVLVLLAGQ